MLLDAHDVDDGRLHQRAQGRQQGAYADSGARCGGRGARVAGSGRGAETLGAFRLMRHVPCRSPATPSVKTRPRRLPGCVGKSGQHQLYPEGFYRRARWSRVHAENRDVVSQEVEVATAGACLQLGLIAAVRTQSADALARARGCGCRTAGVAWYRHKPSVGGPVALEEPDGDVRVGSALTKRYGNRIAIRELGGGFGDESWSESSPARTDEFSEVRPVGVS
jgi:hypothetical protein